MIYTSTSPEKSKNNNSASVNTIQFEASFAHKAVASLMLGWPRYLGSVRRMTLLKKDGNTNCSTWLPFSAEF